MSCSIAVRVNYYGLLREITGKRSDRIALESTALKDLLTILRKSHRNSFESLFPGAPDFSSHFNIFVNRVVVLSENIAEVVLKEGDEIDLFTPVSGG